MATRKPTRNSSRRASSSGSGSIGGFLLGILVTACVVAALAFYFHMPLPSFHSGSTSKSRSKSAPAVTSDNSAANSDFNSDDRPKTIAPAAPPATAPRAPFPISEDVFEAGARLYVKTPASKATGSTSCATCHGTPGRLGAKSELSPGAAEFFLSPSPVTRSPSQLFVRTKYGVAGAPTMPAYAGALTDVQIWQIALLLSHAGEPLPDPVTHILSLHR